MTKIACKLITIPGHDASEEAISLVESVRSNPLVDRVTGTYMTRQGYVDNSMTKQYWLITVKYTLKEESND